MKSRLFIPVKVLFVETELPPGLAKQVFRVSSKKKTTDPKAETVGEQDGAGASQSATKPQSPAP
jgi:hypothetical protein